LQCKPSFYTIRSLPHTASFQCHVQRDIHSLAAIAAAAAAAAATVETIIVLLKENSSFSMTMPINFHSASFFYATAKKHCTRVLCKWKKAEKGGILGLAADYER
jgi:hypothetical protein